MVCFIAQKGVIMKLPVIKTTMEVTVFRMDYKNIHEGQKVIMNGRTFWVVQCDQYGIELRDTADCYYSFDVDDIITSDFEICE
jgi:hypothetical protein